MSWWPFKRRQPRLEAVPDPSTEPEEEGDDLLDVVEDLRRKVNGLRYDLDDLTERFTRREGREAKRSARARSSIDGEGTANGRLPSLATLRAQGRDPFHGR